MISRKGVCPYEYVNDWENFNEPSLPEKKDFHSHLNMEDITDAEYAPAKKVFKDFKIKDLGEYHDLYVQSDTVLLADVFKNFKNVCTKNMCTMYTNLILKNFFQLLD